VCGIVGIWNYGTGEPAAHCQLIAMRETLTHRGPDASGAHIAGPVGLGHRRLSIIDLESGAQPIGNEDGTIWTIFNGEIYNYAELRRDLIAKGHRFATRSDTEVIVHQYEEDGPACVERFRGMFALVVWDQRSRQLTLARDRFGKKPLYVADDGIRLAFASELKALTDVGWVDRRWDAEALRAYMRLGYIPTPYSPYVGVRKMRAGTIETRHQPRPGDPLERRASTYWTPNETVGGDAVPSFATATATLLDLLKESVRLRLRSDVPLGAFLSGGVDSTGVVALMRLCGAAEVKTFSIGFEGAVGSELPYADLAARALGTDHHAQVLTATDARLLPHLVEMLDEPFADDSLIPTFFVSRLAREHVTVALSGDGGDELFAGYGKYRRLQRLHTLDGIPRTVLAGAARIAELLPDGAKGSGLARELRLPREWRMLELAASERDDISGFLSPELRDFLATGHDEPWTSAFRSDGTVTGGQIVDQQTYLVDDIMVKVDRCSMAVSLEARAPLLDHELARFVNGLPVHYKLDRHTSKRVLKEALRPYVPPEILGRRKQGFGMPLRDWLKGPLAQFTQEALLDSADGIFDRQAVGALLRKDDPPRNWHQYVWALITLGCWASRQPQRPW